MTASPAICANEVEIPFSQRPVNILIVDDLPEKLLVYRTVLEDLGHNLVMAHTGEEALKLVLRQEFAVILLDVNMPGMDGFETAELIRGRKKSSHTPIIFLTAFTDEMKMAQGYAKGAVDYLPTPVVPEILKAKVKVFVELFQMRQQAAMQAEERARRLAAEEADRRKDEFLGMLAHELRNPLGPIVNGVQLLEMIGPKDSAIQELRDMIDRQVTHMVRLIDDLLDSTRIAQGKILLRRTRCDLGEIVRKTAEDYRTIFTNGGLTLDVSVPAQPVWINGDVTRLAQAVGNLLHNAHKFTNAGGAVTISLLQDKNSGIAEVTVRDTGIGIDPHILPHIFESFRQSEQGLDRSKGGLGLGLALVKGLVGLHGGEVAASSGGPGTGAVFSVRLPTLEIGIAANDETPALAAASSVKRRILLVEDNKDTARSLRSLLSLEGHEIQTAHTGTAGLQAVYSFRPQIILCDIGLPEMDGYELARTIREDETIGPTYAIALTGYGREEDVRLAREAGFDMHLTKPVDFNNLRRALADAPE